MVPSRCGYLGTWYHRSWTTTIGTRTSPDCWPGIPSVYESYAHAIDVAVVENQIVAGFLGIREIRLFILRIGTEDLGVTPGTRVTPGSLHLLSSPSFMTSEAIDTRPTTIIRYGYCNDDESKHSTAKSNAMTYPTTTATSELVMMMDRAVTAGTRQGREPETASPSTATSTATSSGSRSSRDSLVPRTTTGGTELAVDGIVSSSRILPPPTTTTSNTTTPTPTSTKGDSTSPHHHRHSQAHNIKNNNDKPAMADTTTNRSRRSTLPHHQSTLSTSSMATSNTAPTASSSSTVSSTGSIETVESPRDPVDELLASWEHCSMDQQEHQDLQESPLPPGLPSKVGFTAGTTTCSTNSTPKGTTARTTGTNTASSGTTADSGTPHHDESTNNTDQQDDLQGIDMPLHHEERTGMALFCKSRRGVESSRPLGIAVIQIGWRRVIAHWDPHGLLAQSVIRTSTTTTPCSELQVGQTILAVNGIAANDFASCQDLLDTLEREQKIVIVATQSVLVSLRQGHQTARGLVLGVRSDEGDKNRVIVLHRFHHAADFDDDNNDGPDLRLLQPRMKILAMNNSTHDLDLYEANRILQGYSMGTFQFLRILAVCETD